MAPGHIFPGNFFCNSVIVNMLYSPLTEHIMKVSLKVGTKFLFHVGIHGRISAITVSGSGSLLDILNQ